MMHALKKGQDKTVVQVTNEEELKNLKTFLTVEARSPAKSPKTPSSKLEQIIKGLKNLFSRTSSAKVMKEIESAQLPVYEKFKQLDKTIKTIHELVSDAPLITYRSSTLASQEVIYYATSISAESNPGLLVERLDERIQTISADIKKGVMFLDYDAKVYLKELIRAKTSYESLMRASPGESYGKIAQKFLEQERQVIQDVKHTTEKWQQERKEKLATLKEKESLLRREIINSPLGHLLRS